MDLILRRSTRQARRNRQQALLATHGNEIFLAAQKKGVMVAFEAAVAGGVPNHQGAS